MDGAYGVLVEVMSVTDFCSYTRSVVPIPAQCVWHRMFLLFILQGRSTNAETMKSFIASVRRPKGGRGARPIPTVNVGSTLNLWRLEDQKSMFSG